MGSWIHQTRVSCSKFMFHIQVSTLCSYLLTWLLPGSSLSYPCTICCILTEATIFAEIDRVLLRLSNWSLFNIYIYICIYLSSSYHLLTAAANKNTQIMIQKSELSYVQSLSHENPLNFRWDSSIHRPTCLAGKSIEPRRSMFNTTKAPKTDAGKVGTAQICLAIPVTFKNYTYEAKHIFKTAVIFTKETTILDECFHHRPVV